MVVCDIEKFLDAAQNHNVYGAVVIRLGSGLRIGELLALNWPDIDFTKAEVYVTETLIRSKGEKTEKS